MANKLLTNKALVALYWVVALVLAVLAAIALGQWAVDEQAPTFHGGDDKGAPATTTSHVLFGAVGGFIGFGLVMALAAGIWMYLWAKNRGELEQDDYDEYDHDVDLLVGDDDEQAADDESEAETGADTEADGLEEERTR